MLGWVVSYARPLGAAIATATAALAISVAVFFVGLKVFHDIKWAAAGSTLGIDWDRAMLWMLLAVPAGVLLGSLGHFAPEDSWRGTASRAAVAGALAAECLARLAEYGIFDAAVLLDALAATALLAASTARRPGWGTAALTAVTVPAWLLLLRVPDVLEGFTGWR